MGWQNAGRMLEKLTLYGVSFSRDQLQSLRNHWNNLKHIHISSWQSENAIIAEFIASYGEQLELVYVNNMAEGELNLVAGSCINARFHAFICTEHLLIPTLRILGPRLDNILIICIINGFNKEEWEAAWKLCTSLRVLDTSLLKVEEIRAIMHTPKLYLTEVSISFSRFRDVDDSTKETVMNIITEGTMNLHILRFRGNPSLTASSKLIQKNYLGMSAWCRLAD